MAHRLPLAILGTLGLLSVAVVSPAPLSGQDYTQYEVQFMTVSWSG